MSERIDTEKLRHVADQPWAEYAPDIHASLHAMADEIDYLRESEANARAIFAKLREIMGVQMGDGVSILEHADRLRATIAEQAEKLAAAERERDMFREDRSKALASLARTQTERDIARSERDAAVARAERLAEAMEAIRIRASEGDRRTDWLPTIRNIACAALSDPPAPTLGERLVKLVRAGYVFDHSEKGGVFWRHRRESGSWNNEPTLESAVAAAERADKGDSNDD